MIASRIAGLLIILALIIAAAGSLVFFLGPSYIIRPFFVSLHRQIVALFFLTWWSLVVYWFDALNGVRHIYYGDRPRENDSVLIISNHLSEFDMPFFWRMALHMRTLGLVKFVGKDAILKVPILGWGAKMCEFLFIRRKWEQDQHTIHEHLSSFSARGDPLWLVLFPEGTDFAERKLPKSHAFQEEHGLPKLYNVLQPRSKGLYACVQALRNTPSLTAIYDQTWAYEDRPRSPFDLILGINPRVVHIHTRRVNPADLGESTEDTDRWVTASFQEKEKLIENFKRNRAFSDDAYELPSCVNLRMVLTLIFWAIVISSTLYLWWVSAFARWYTIIVFILLHIWSVYF
eukprot:Rmarinus@m.26072